MIKFDAKFSTIEGVLEATKNRIPKFDNILNILQGKKPDRATLFEFFMNNTLYEKLAGEKIPDVSNYSCYNIFLIKAFKNAGYDYVTVTPHPDFTFQRHQHNVKKTISLNEQLMITDWDSFNEYLWPDAGSIDYSYLKQLEDYLPAGMKVIVSSPAGVLENAIAVLGFDNLCFHLIDNPDLVHRTFDRIGNILTEFYKICVGYDSVGACIVNDDWGFNKQTMLAPDDMRKYVLPWHKRIVEVIHNAGKPVILHSCGYLDEVITDIIDVIGFDGKHSYEDNIRPVEETYELYNGKIAVMGGIDMDFVCRKTPQEVFERSRRMLEKSNATGGYALGTGNSVPEYVPMANYYAMISAALNE